MRAADIVAQLHRRLPLVTNAFSDELSVVTVAHGSGTALVQTATAHGLVPGAQVTIFGSRTPVPVDSISHVSGASYAVVTTSEDHDLTLYRFRTDANVVEIDGANEAEFNGLRSVVAVPNRRTVHVSVDTGAPLSATGAMRLLGASSYLRNVRGLYSVMAAPTPTTFTVGHPSSSDLGVLVGPAIVRARPRVTGAQSPRSAILSHSQEAGGAASKPWLYVVLDDSTPVRQTAAPAEAFAVNKLSGGWSQLVVQRFGLLLALPNVSDERGRTARDLAADLLGPIARCLLGAEFDTGFSVSRPAAPVAFAGESSQETEVGAWYGHRFDFEQIARMGLADTVGNDEHVAFRDIDVEIGHGSGGDVVELDVDLDEVPLP